MALKPARATKASPGTTNIIRPPISPNAAVAPSSIQVVKKANATQSRNGVTATTMTNTAAELSSSEGRFSLDTCRSNNETARRMKGPSTKKSRNGRVFTSRSGKIPDVAASKSR